MNKNRQIDKEVKESLHYFFKLKLVSYSFIKKWRFLLVLIFIIGFITAVIWMISDKYFFW